MFMLYAHVTPKSIKFFTHVKKVGAHSRICLAFIDELEKQLFIKKTVEVGQQKM